MDPNLPWRVGDTVEPMGDLPPSIREVWPRAYPGTVVAAVPYPPDDYWLTVRVLESPCESPGAICGTPNPSSGPAARLRRVALTPTLSRGERE